MYYAVKVICSTMFNFYNRFCLGWVVQVQVEVLFFQVLMMKKKKIKNRVKKVSFGSILSLFVFGTALPLPALHTLLLCYPCYFKCLTNPIKVQWIVKSLEKSFTGGKFVWNPGYDIKQMNKLQTYHLWS